MSGGNLNMTGRENANANVWKEKRAKRQRIGRVWRVCETVSSGCESIAHRLCVILAHRNSEDLLDSGFDVYKGIRGVEQTVSHVRTVPLLLLVDFCQGLDGFLRCAVKGNADGVR